MDLEIKINVGKEMDFDKIIIGRLVEDNLKNKLDNYLGKFDKENAEGKIEVKVEKNKKNLFNAVLMANLDGNSFRYKREDYKNLDDLINHLFDHFKQELSDK